MTIELRDLSAADKRQVLLWLGDEPTNYTLGFGKGAVGRLGVKEWLAARLGFCLGAERDGEFVALVEVEDRGHRTARAMVLVDPEKRRQGVGAEVVQELFAQLFKDEIYRVESRLLGINHPGIAFCKDLGMWQESIEWCAHWQDKNPYDIVRHSLLRREWMKPESGKHARENREEQIIIRDEMRKEKDDVGTTPEMVGVAAGAAG